MSIGKVIALTVGDVKRQWSYIGRMTARGVPLDSIHFVLGKNPRDFGNDFATVAEAANDDGFPFVRFFQGHGDTGIVKQSPAQMCQVWEFARILRLIANMEENCLLTWDDRTLTVPFLMLDDMVDTMSSSYQDGFYLFQLRLRGCEEYLKLNVESFWESRYIHENLFQGYVNPGKGINYAETFAKLGMHGYDESIVFSPQGANWMLEQMQKIKDIDPDIKKIKYKDVSMSQKPIYCRILNIDNWICWGLPPAIKAALKDDKGIFCPRYPGFDFIEDGIPLGSTTDWASREYELHDRIKMSSNLQYLETS